MYFSNLYDSQFFRKNFVKAMVLLKKLIDSLFDEILFSVKENFSFFHTVILTLIWQKSRETNVFTKEITK